MLRWKSPKIQEGSTDRECYLDFVKMKEWFMKNRSTKKDSVDSWKVYINFVEIEWPKDVKP